MSNKIDETVKDSGLIAEEAPLYKQKELSKRIDENIQNSTVDIRPDETIVEVPTERDTH